MEIILYQLKNCVTRLLEKKLWNINIELKRTLPGRTVRCNFYSSVCTRRTFPCTFSSDRRKARRSLCSPGRWWLSDCWAPWTDSRSSPGCCKTANSTRWFWSGVWWGASVAESRTATGICLSRRRGRPGFVGTRRSIWPPSRTSRSRPLISGIVGRRSSGSSSGNPLSFSRWGSALGSLNRRDCRLFDRRIYSSSKDIRKSYPTNHFTE